MRVPELKISFVIPVFNEVALIADRLSRLQGYREAGHELIVIDGGSCDGSAEKLQSLADRVEIWTAGRAGQMNRGAELASGDVFLFLHIDTELPPAVDQLIAVACKNADWGWFDLKLDDDTWPYPLIARMMNWRSRLSSVCTGDQSLFVCRELFERVGGFPLLPLMEDVAICKRLRASSAAVTISSKVSSSARRWRERGVFSTIVLMWWLRLQYFLGRHPDKLVEQYYRANMPEYPHSRLAIFLREPVLGRVKTRLAATLGEEAALAIYLSMAKRIVSRCLGSGLADVQLWVSSNESHEYFRALCQQKNIYKQSGEDLGLKMANASRDILQQQDVQNLVIIGSDCPAIDAKYLASALRALTEVTANEPMVVLGPAEDGGYVLIGMNSYIPGLFEGIQWGTQEVLNKTVAFLQREKIDYQLLPTLWDVDEAEDLPRLSSLDPPFDESLY